MINMGLEKNETFEKDFFSVKIVIKQVNLL